MATRSQILMQQGQDARYTNGEVVVPVYLPPGDTSHLTIHSGVIPDGTDFGDVKVEDGKLVLDLDDMNYDADLGKF